MKALLSYREIPFRKTHNLTELGGSVAHIEHSLAELMRKALMITEFAWRFRTQVINFQSDWRMRLKRLQLRKMF